MSLYDVKTLLLHVAEGNEAAFRNLFDRYKEPFYSAALKMTRSEDVAEEIVQETFVSLWIKREQLAGALKPESYLFTVLHNSIYSHFRKLALERKMRQRAGINANEADDNPVEEILLDKENAALLQSVIDKLPAQQKLVYQLSKQRGLSREQIAEQLQISPNTVKNHLQNATHFIHEYFKNNLSALIWLALWNSL